MDSPTPPNRASRAYPITPAPADDPRFTLGVALDIAEVLARHGYPQVESGRDLVDLQQAIFHFLYGAPAAAPAPLVPAPAADTAGARELAAAVREALDVPHAARYEDLARADRTARLRGAYVRGTLASLADGTGSARSAVVALRETAERAPADYPTAADR
ncbi:hypothetical protein [Streptomyces sp. NPDC049881]|uniref:hypothetical protein n=1 Tax=Streptomyces sp. NPDC049881 TaxID=3155778 RepID=UPI0034131FF7